MKTTTLAMFLAVLCGCQTMQAEEPAAGKMVQVKPEDAKRVPYWLYLPKTYDANTDKLPVLIFLHGMGERGDNLKQLLKHGPPKHIIKGEHYPFIMIAPQCPDDGHYRDKNKKAKAFWWMPETVDKVKHILDYEKERLGRIDGDRAYITGLSMGGFGTYHLISRHPKTFAAAAPICGHGNNGIKNWKDMAHVPFWAFHGDKDKAVKLADQQKTIDALKAVGASIKFTVYPGVGHDSWSRTYANPEFYKWLLAQKRGTK